jgi:outer membrane protein TolC
MKTVFKYISLALAVGLITPTVQAQKKLSLQEAVNLAVEQNPEVLASSLEIEKSKQQKVVSRSLFLPSVSLSAQANHYFRLTPFFGFGETAADGKIV